MPALYHPCSQPHGDASRAGGSQRRRHRERVQAQRQNKGQQPDHVSYVSAERVRDPDTRIVLAVVQIFGQDFSAAHHTGGLDDRGVPV